MCARCDAALTYIMVRCPRCGYAGPQRSSTLARVGYLLGLLVAPVGFVIALVLFARNEIGPAFATLGCCLLGTVAALALVVS